MIVFAETFHRFFYHFKDLFVKFFVSFILVTIPFLLLFSINLFIMFLLLFGGFYARWVMNHLLLTILKFMGYYYNLLLAFKLLLSLLVNSLHLLPFIRLLFTFHPSSFLLLYEQLFLTDVIILVPSCSFYDLRFLISITWLLLMIYSMHLLFIQNVIMGHPFIFKLIQLYHWVSHF